MKDEPVLTGGLIKVVASVLITLAAKYGLHLKDDEVTAVLAAAFTSLSAVVSYVTRAKVVPVSTIKTKLLVSHPGAFKALMEKTS